ncbi:MAG TPA: RNA methyltransferase substrate-binding domain-containing protein, partial [Sphingomonas sp.]
MAAKRGHRPREGTRDRPRFWGRHAVSAALANPDRVVRKLWATREAAAQLDVPAQLPITFSDVADLGRMVPPDAPHQGVVAEVEPLEEIW